MTSTTLPYKDAEFNGEIKITYNESTSDFPQPISAPEGAPNIVVIMTDDVGFGAASTFGGPVQTETMSAIAKEGLKYNRFHTTALCSPTRASLLTGRLPHNAGTGIIMERALGFPGYNSLIPKTTVTFAEVLRQNGFTTGWFGKNHNTPDWQTSSIGPFDQWPNNMGFDFFYGFLGGDCNQFQPNVFKNTTAIHPQDDNPDYHLDTDIADQAIEWVNEMHALDPKKPFLMYYVPGATHSPHHVPADRRDKYKGQFDDGWDKLRERTHLRQIMMGIVPPDTKLTPRPDNLPAWEDTSDDQKKLFTRMMEIYAAYLDLTDENIGRVLTAIDDLGLTDNTLVIYIQGDNGGSAEGTTQGTLNEVATVGNYIPEDFDMMFEKIDEIGGPLHYNHFPVQWAWALNSPMQWTKRYASHFGGTRNGMVMKWPKKIEHSLKVRSQFHHVIDIAPTIFEAVGITYPITEVNGIVQIPMDGTSMAYTWDKGNADREDRRTQLFEMFGNRGIYHEGWMACTTPLVFAWEQEPENITPDSFEWELYNLDNDFSQGMNLAKDPLHHAKLEELKSLWWIEAGKNNTLPLNFSPAATVTASAEHPSLTEGRSKFTYLTRVSGITESAAPPTKNCSYTITADVTVPDSPEGVIVTQGGRFAGYGLYFFDGKLNWVYRYSHYDSAACKITAPDAIPAGDHKIVVNFNYAGGSDVGKGGLFCLSIDGTEVGQGKIDITTPAKFTITETFDIGKDSGTPIDDEYDNLMPYEFNGDISKVVVELDTSNQTEDTKKSMNIAAAKFFIATD